MQVELVTNSYVRNKGLMNSAETLEKLVTFYPLAPM